MPTQTPSLIMKGRDGGWEGTQIQFYTCSECGAQASGASQHSGWHDNLTQTLQAFDNALQQLNNAINQVAQQSQNADAQQNQRISALEARP